MKSTITTKLLVFLALLSYSVIGFSQTNCNNTVTSVSYSPGMSYNFTRNFTVEFNDDVRYYWGQQSASDFYKFYVVRQGDDAPTNLDEWYNLFDSTSYQFSGLDNFSFNIEGINAYRILPVGNYTFYYKNIYCNNAPTQSFNFTVSDCSYYYQYFSLSSGVTGTALPNGVKFTWDYSQVLKSSDYEYRFWKEGNPTPTQWTQHSGFYANTVTLNKDENNDDVDPHSNYYFEVRIKGCVDYSTNYVSTYISANYCTATLTGLQFTSNQNANPENLAFKFNAVTPAPANGYAYAIGEVGSTPSYPDDYIFIGNTTQVSNIDTTFSGDAIQNQENYTVYVYAVCDSTSSIDLKSDIATASTSTDWCSGSVQNFDITDNNDGSITVTWDDPAGFVPNDGYFISVYNSSSPSPNFGDFIALGNNTYSFTTDTIFTSDPLGFGYIHVDLISACDTANGVYNLSTEDIYLEECGVTPENLSVTQIDSTLEVSWDLNATAPDFGYAVVVYEQGTAEPTEDKWTFVDNTVNSIVFDSTSNENAFVNYGSYVVSVYAVCDSTLVDGALTSPSVDVVANVQYICNLTVGTPTVVDNQDGTVDLSWAATTGATGYYYSLVPSSVTNPAPPTYVFSATTTVNSVDATTELNPSVIANAKEYTVYVKATCDADFALASVASSSSFTADNCPTPQNLTYTYGDWDEFTATWDTITSPLVDGYSYYRGLTPSNYPNLSDFYPTGTLLEPSLTNYYYYNQDTTYLEVIAVCANGESFSLPATIEIVPSNCMNNVVNTDLSLVSMDDTSVTYQINNYGAGIPAEGYGYVVYPNSLNPTPTTTLQQLTITQDTLITITKDFLGDDLVHLGSYRIELYTLCDTANNIWDWNDSENFTFNSCPSFTNSNLYVVSNSGTGKVDFKINNTTLPNGYYYAVTNGSKFYDPIFPADYTFTNDTIVEDIDKLYDETTIASLGGGTIYVKIKPVCNVDQEVYGTEVYRSVVVQNAFCSPASGLTVTYSNGVMNATWDATSNKPVDGYAYYIIPKVYGGSFDENWLQYLPNTATSVSMNQTSLGDAFIEGNDYYFYIISLCDKDELIGDNASVMVTAIAPIPANCEGVSDLTITDRDNGSIDISWDYATASTGGFYYAIVPHGTIPTADDYKHTVASPLYNVTTTTTATPEEFVSGEAYDVYVKAYCEAGDNYSDESSKSIIIYNSLGLNDETANNVAVYPNPTTGNLTIEVSQLDGTSVSITDVTGKIVYTSELVDVSTTIDMHNMANGVYIVNVMNTESKRAIRVVKQ